MLLETEAENIQKRRTFFSTRSPHVRVHERTPYVNVHYNATHKLSSPTLIPTTNHANESVDNGYRGCS